MYRRRFYVLQVPPLILQKLQIVCPAAVQGDEMSEDSAELARTRHRQCLSYRPIQNRAWYILAETAVISMLAGFLAVFRYFLPLSTQQQAKDNRWEHLLALLCVLATIPE